jgi:hypothetical protein
MKLVKKAVTKQYESKFDFRLSFNTFTVDLFLIIFNEKLIPFTPSAIRQGTMIISFAALQTE